MVDLMSIEDLTPVQKLQKRSREIDEQYNIKRVEELEKPKEVKEIPLQEGPLFNLYKRSLPPGIDKIVEMGLTRAEAIEALFGRHKTVEKDIGGSTMLIYYDIIAQNASDAEMNIYYNPPAIVK